MTKESLLDEILRLAPEARLEFLEMAWAVVSVDPETTRERAGPGEQALDACDAPPSVADRELWP